MNCTKHAAVYTSITNSKLLIKIRSSAQLLSYLFGTKTAEFFCCATCGNLCYVLSKINKQTFAVINTNVLDNDNNLQLIKSRANYDGERLKDRLARREKNWISTVEIITDQ